MNLNNSSHADETLQWTPGSLYLTRITLWSITLVWSLLGNVLVIAVVYCNQNLRTNVNYLIVNMAVSDLLIPLIAIPWMISREKVRESEWLVEGPLGEALCKLVPFLSEIPTFVSSINLVIIAFQRFIAVVYPTPRHVLTPKTRWILIAIPWIVAMALFSPYFYIYNLINERGYTKCMISWSPSFNKMTSDIIFYSTITTVGFVIPLITIIILYTIIHYKLRKSLKNVVKLIEREMLCSRQRRNRRIFYMSITIIVMFTIGWCPLGVFSLLLATQHSSIMTMDVDKFTTIYHVFIFLWFLQAAINPCIYFVFLRDFRQGLKRLCSRKTALENVQANTLWVCCASTVAKGGDDNDDPKSPLHIKTTTV